ncbi:MAG: hypothetical protein H6705_16755 [Myxococcales bacterium]|nr:hypothetical protein [Myxococcales bacterium]
MPDTRRSPRFALASAFDARPWSGADLFERGELDPIAMPEWGTGEGVYLDALHFLHGFGSAEAFDADLAAFGVTIELDEQDRVVITNAGDADVTLAGQAGNVWWGLPTVGTLINKEGGQLVGTDWRRGIVTAGPTSSPPRLVFSVDGELGFFRAPPEKGWVQDVRVGLRTRGEVEDLDDITTTLEALDNATNDSTDLGYRWGVDDDGHVYWTGTAAEAADGITWLDATFRDRLGFTGDEPVGSDNPGAGPGFVAGVMYYQRAARPLPGLIVPTRPMSAMIIEQEEESEALRLTDGSFASSWIGTYTGYAIEWWLDGPAGAVDLHHHWLQLRERYVHAGEPLTLYWTWGDSRRRLHPHEVTADRTAYDLLHTTDRRGYAGRSLGRLHGDGGANERIEWQSAIWLRARRQTRIALREEGV